MKILVIVGSPKGKDSITLHTCLCLEKKFPGHRFTYLYAGTRVKALEKDFSPALEAIEAADLLVFCYPVYTFLVPSQLHRFIEKMKESGKDFSGKAATQVTTSKHFYDITAHRFIEDNCADMGIPFLDGLSADMDDILKPEDTGLKAMIDRFTATGKCVYKDGFDDFLRNTIHRHNAILYAFRIKDHSMGYRFKMYDDRQFCNGHRTVTMGTPFGYLVGWMMNSPKMKAKMGGKMSEGMIAPYKKMLEEAEKESG